MSDEEVLCPTNGLSQHLNDLGYIDFETYESGTQKSDKSSASKKLNRRHKNSRPRPSFERETSGLIPISSHDHIKVMTLLKSKLLFVEDMELIESVLSFCDECSQKSKKYYTMGAVATSCISMAAYLNRGFELYLPLGLMAISSAYVAWKVYLDISETLKNKLFTQYVKSLQNLCINIHKVLRLLKELEILSTGQVSTENLGSAMYIPGSNVKDLNSYPTWKTLPDVRKSLANSLVDVLTIFLCGCDSMKELTPSWMDIKGFTSTSQLSLKQTQAIFESISKTNGCISIKDLQIFNDSYLLVQSEFLKWTAFYLCPIVWTSSNESLGLVNFKAELFKFFENTNPKISDISLKLELSLDLQKLFTCHEPKHQVQRVLLDRCGSSSFKELNEIQIELHQVFLLVLSTVQQAKRLEDSLESIASLVTPENYTSLSDLKKDLSQQLSCLRNDLAKVVKDYDYIYCQLLNSRKSEKGLTENLKAQEKCDSKSHQPQTDDAPRVAAGFSDFAINPSDEVFVAISGSKTEDFGIDFSDWCLELKPKIPKTLLTELSTTLKPIKKDFEERERLVLNKLGIQDIENSDSEDKENLESRSCRNCPPKRNVKSPTPLHRKHSTDSPSDCEELQIKSSCSTNANDHNELMVHSSKALSIANLIKMNPLAVQRGNLEEEFFSEN